MRGVGEVNRVQRRGQHGLTLVEMVLTIAVVLIMAAASAPLANSALAQFRLKSAVTSVTGIIQSTRFQAISNGYIYKIAFDKTNHTYQISSDTTGSGTFTTVGGAVPFSGSPVALDNNATVQLSPSGKVTFITGASPLVLTLRGQTGTIMVTPYGNLSVKYGS